MGSGFTSPISIPFPLFLLSGDCERSFRDRTQIKSFFPGLSLSHPSCRSSRHSSSKFFPSCTDRDYTSSLSESTRKSLPPRTFYCACWTAGLRAPFLTFCLSLSRRRLGMTRRHQNKQRPDLGVKSVRSTVSFLRHNGCRCGFCIVKRANDSRAARDHVDFCARDRCECELSSLRGRSRHGHPSLH